MATIHVNGENFEQVIKENKKVVVDFWAEWCAPCRVISPILEKLDQEIDELTIAKVDVDQNQDLASQYSIRSIPTLKLFQDGKEIKSTVGVQSLEDLKAWIED